MTNIPVPFAARRGIMMMEAAIAIALAVAMGMIVAQCIAISVRERARLAAHHAALEMAANILEAARSQPVEQIDQKWADLQTIPSEAAALLPGAKVIVTVEPGQPVSHSRRVIAEVRWHYEPQAPLNSVRLVTVLTTREAKKGGDKK